MLRDAIFCTNFWLQRWKNFLFRRFNVNQMKQYQEKKLKKIVRYAVKKTAFYKNLYSDIDVSKEVQIKKIPIIAKGDIVGNFNQMITVDDVKEEELKQYFKEPFDFNKRFRNKYLAFHTSGSTGNPISIVWGEDVFGISLSNYFFKIKSIISIKKVKKIKVVYIGITDDYVGGNSWVYGMKNYVNIKILSVFLSEMEMVSELNKFQPDIIFTKPSVLGKLAKKQQEGSLSIQPKDLIFAGEMISPADLMNIQQYFGLKPINSYSTCETGPVAIQTVMDSDGLEIFDDMVLVELVDDDGNVITNFYQTGNVVITNLYNKYFPIIRYKIGDKAYYIPSSKDKMGRELSYIQGRGTSFFTLKDSNENYVKVAEFPFWSLYVPGISRYQVIQTSYIEFHIMIEYENDMDRRRKEEVRESFIHKLKRILEPYQLQDIIQITLDKVDKINMNSAGKIQVTIPLK